MHVRLLALAMLCSCALVEAQISVSDSGIRAHLLNGVTTISLPVKNRFKQAVETKIHLAWIGLNDMVHEQVDESITLAPGATAVDIPSSAAIPQE